MAALRNVRVRSDNDSKVTRHVGNVGKTFFQMPDIKSRPALGSIGNNIQERNPAAAALKRNPIALKQETKLAGIKERPAKVVLPVAPTLPSSSCSPEDMDMDMGKITEEFAQQLHIDDIDSIDAENPQLCAEYAKDIYAYMKELEVKFHVPPSYMKKQPCVNSRMRCILIDWLIQVHHRFNLLQETLYLTISIIDRYLQTSAVKKEKLQLVGVTAMLLASKYEEMYAPDVHDFVEITANTYKVSEILSMERVMLKELDFSFGNPLCLHFLRRNSRAGEATPEMHTMAKFLMELCLQDIQMLEFLPSQQAAAALYISMKLYSAGDWTPTLQHYSTYSVKEIMPCVQRVAQLVLDMPHSKQQAVKNKFSTSKYMKVSEERSLSGQIIKDLASNSAA